MNTVVIEPGLSDVEVDDGLAEVFEDVFHVGCVLLDEEGLVVVDCHRCQLG